jgi:hypothetical protein
LAASPDGKPPKQLKIQNITETQNSTSNSPQV